MGWRYCKYAFHQGKCRDSASVVMSSTEMFTLNMSLKKQRLEEAET
jgi:hypothetical protein